MSKNLFAALNQSDSLIENIGTRPSSRQAKPKNAGPVKPATCNVRDLANCAWYIDVSRSYLPSIAALDEIARKKIYETLHTDEEIKKAEDYLCDEHGWDRNRWDLIMDVDEVIWDTRRKMHGLKPIHSRHLCDLEYITTLQIPKALNHVIDVEKVNKQNARKISQTSKKTKIPEPIQSDVLPCPVALVRDPKTVDILETACIMRTAVDYWKDLDDYSLRNSVRHNQDIGALFSGSLANMEKEAEDHVNAIMRLASANQPSQTNQRQNRSKAVDDAIHKQACSHISAYNDIHPVWAFIRLDPSFKYTKEDAPPIKIPIIRDANNRSTNTIDISLKDTDRNSANGIYCVDEAFEFGYIPTMVLALIGGNFPADVIAIVFHKTVNVDRSQYFRGFRVRIVISNPCQESFSRCKDYINKTFVQENSQYGVDFSKCVIRISTPR